MHRTTTRVLHALVVLIAITGCAAAHPAPAGPAAPLRERYEKREVRIPMRDGVKLFTSIYLPRDTDRPVPILMRRTPYGVHPYGEDRFPGTLGPSGAFDREGYIFVLQDVRGCHLSEGEFVNMRPHLDAKSDPRDIDESTDTFDTIEWLLANVPNHNGRVGMWGVSYPGFYAAAGMIDAHPALAAVSPQAPIADWYFDDFFHHGAFFLPHAFNFFASFGRPRPEPTTRSAPRFDHGTPDGYRFFLDLGPLSNANERYFHGEIAFWNEIAAHPNYDEFWRSRNLLPHLRHVAPAVMTVGGWFDAEDLYGPLAIYRSVEAKNPGVFNVLVMGPWSHGGWAWSDGDRLGNVDFGARTSDHYRNEIELPFFRRYLADGPDPGLSEATVFETGTNVWRSFDAWPPRGREERRLFLHATGHGARSGHAGASFAAPGNDARDAFVEYPSDPARPVPYTEAITTGMTKEYMTDDQRFAARRPDVAVFETEPLAESLTLAGPVVADLWVSTSGTASDWVVKLVDVFPATAPDPPQLPEGRHMGGYQMMVRSEVIRGRFRNGYERPEPFVANEPAKVTLPLQDVLHTFRPGHRIMVQIQSTWFPLVDRNPHHFAANVFEASPEDFVPATQRVHCSPAHPSCLRLGILPAEKAAAGKERR